MTDKEIIMAAEIDLFKYRRRSGKGRQRPYHHGRAGIADFVAVTGQAGDSGQFFSMIKQKSKMTTIMGGTT